MATFLHDGRARTLAEAILWHGGEAEAAREAFRLASHATARRADRVPPDAVTCPVVQDRDSERLTDVVDAVRPSGDRRAPGTSATRGR